MSLSHLVNERTYGDHVIILPCEWRDARRRCPYLTLWMMGRVAKMSLSHLVNERTYGEDVIILPCEWWDAWHGGPCRWRAPRCPSLSRPPSATGTNKINFNIWRHRPRDLARSLWLVRNYKHSSRVFRVIQKTNYLFSTINYHNWCEMIIAQEKNILKIPGAMWINKKRSKTNWNFYAFVLRFLIYFVRIRIQKGNSDMEP